MAIGDNPGLILYQGQWITPEQYTAITSIPAQATPSGQVVVTQPAPELEPTPEQAPAPAPMTESEEIRAQRQAYREQQQQPEGQLNIIRAVEQPGGDIAYQIEASPEGNNMGILTTLNLMSSGNLSPQQEQQLRDYVKAHPEQQFQKKKQVAYYNAYGMAVYEGEPDPLDVSNDKAPVPTVAEPTGVSVSSSAPLVIPFYYGGKTQDMGLLMPDTMVYPMPGDVATIYPQKIPLSMQEDPRSGLYAVGFEGTVQSNIYFDPISRKFYNRFITEPVSAIDIMRYTKDAKGQQSGIDVVNAMIDANEQQIIVNPVNRGWIKENVTPNLPKATPTVRMQSPEEMAGVPNLGISSDSPFAQSFSILPVVQKDQSKQAVADKIGISYEEFEKANAFGQQFAISMIPLPGFISKPIGKVAGAVIGKASRQPVIGPAVKEYIKISNMHPGEVITKPWTDKKLAVVAENYNNRLGFEATANVVSSSPTTAKGYNKLYGFKESNVVVKTTEGERLVNFEYGDYPMQGLSVTTTRSVPRVSTRSVRSPKTDLSRYNAFKLGQSVPTVIPSVVGGLAVSQSQSQAVPTTNVQPNINVVQPPERVAPTVNIEIPKIKVKTKTDTSTDTIPVQITGQQIGQQTPQKTTPKTTTTQLSVPMLKPSVARSQSATIKPMFPGSMIGGAFSVRPFRKQGVYTYKNNPDAILGAIGGMTPKKKGKGKKRGSRRSLI